MNQLLESQKTSKILSAQVFGAENLKKGNKELPVVLLLYSNNDNSNEEHVYKIYIPYTEFLSKKICDNLPPQKILKLLYKFIYTDINFIVINVDDIKHIAIASKIKADEKLAKPNTDINKVHINDIKTFNILNVAKTVMLLEFNGIKSLVKLGDFPGLLTLDFRKLYSVGDSIKCKIKQIVLPINNSDAELIISPVDYKKIEQSFIELNGYYSGFVSEIVNDLVTVDVNGYKVYCKYPLTLVPIKNCRTIVNIISSKDIQNKSFNGRIVSAELPFSI